VLGARVPIVLSRRADNPLSYQVACALALLLARRAPVDTNHPSLPALV
jgi:hypothetical protein